MKAKKQKQETDVLQGPSRPPCGFHSMLCEAEGAAGFSVAQLIKAADKYGMTLEGVSRHAAILDEFDLEASDVTRHTITRAELYLRRWAEGLRDRVDRLNGTESAPGASKGAQTTKDTKKTNNALKRALLLGRPLYRMVQWMGSELWTSDEAIAVLKHFGLEVPRNRLCGQLRIGRLKSEGLDLPSLTGDEENHLYEILEGCKEK